MQRDLGKGLAGIGVEAIDFCCIVVLLVYFDVLCIIIVVLTFF